MTSYRVEFTDVAQAEADAAYLWRSQITTPEQAFAWYTGLFVEALQLSTMPRRFERVRNSDRYGGEVRRMLYGRGPVAYHLVYRIIEPAEDESEGVVRILHVYHGASQAAGGRTEEGERDAE